MAAATNARLSRRSPSRPVTADHGKTANSCHSISKLAQERFTRLTFSAHIRSIEVLADRSECRRWCPAHLREHRRIAARLIVCKALPHDRSGLSFFNFPHIYPPILMSSRCVPLASAARVNVSWILRFESPNAFVLFTQDPRRYVLHENTGCERSGTGAMTAGTAG